MTPDTDSVGKRQRIERQRRLPFARAVEISFKSIRVRFWRSMLTVSSIILAIAFLMWQLTSAEIVRRLAEVAENPREMDQAAGTLSLKEEAAALKTEVETYREDNKGTIDEYDTADKRLQSAIDLAAVEPAEEHLREARAEFERVRKAFEGDTALLKVGEEAQGLERRVTALKERRRLNPGNYEALTTQIKGLEEELARIEDDYIRFKKRRTAYTQAQKARDSAEDSLEKARTKAEKARKTFTDLTPAPPESPELERLLAARKAAQRRKEEVEERITRLENRAESADQRYRNATAKHLRELLAQEESTETTRVEMPWGLSLTSSRLWIIALALLVCLVGITNAMLMSVTERYREIGTMKCLGALDNFIVKIFLLESSVMGALGVVFGIVLGFVLAFLVQLGNYGGFVTRYFPALDILKWAGVAFVVGAALTVLGGILPARRAAGMQPVDAMRIEE